MPFVLLLLRLFNQRHMARGHLSPVIYSALFEINCRQIGPDMIVSSFFVAICCRKEILPTSGILKSK